MKYPTRFARVFTLVVALATLATLPRAASAKEDPHFYEKHIIAVDRDGSALVPNVVKKGDGYVARPTPMPGEAPAEIAQHPGRKPYYDYLSAMFAEITRTRPKNIVIYIHGGMNLVTGAIEKGAQFADEYRGREGEEYRICICWSSNLFSTYGEHLFGNDEGLRSTTWAKILSPLTLLGDLGSTVGGAPRTLVRLLTNDVHAVRPMWFDRDMNALARQLELEAKYQTGRPDAIATSMAEDGRQGRPVAKAADVVGWTATLPAKIATAPIIEGLGKGAWQMMLRRTRTMFERETSFTSKAIVDELHRRHRDLNIQLVNGRPVSDTGALSREELAAIDTAVFSGRPGAVRLFFEEAERYIGLAGKSARLFPTKVTLIGHSMGAIVTNEILARFDHVDFDNIVFLAAACRINDFQRAGVPYLSRHPRARFYNLCLHPQAERAEKEPANLMIYDPVFFPIEVAPRGSLLVWIDSFLDHPESEGDRTFGRWENAVLAMDALPNDITGRITIKTFGRDRPPETLKPGEGYSDPQAMTSGGWRPKQYVNEPVQHGDFSRFKLPENQKKPNFKFTSERYRKPEGGKH